MAKRKGVVGIAKRRSTEHPFGNPHYMEVDEEVFQSMRKVFPPTKPITNNHKTKRNELCPCNSGKKFKKCHLNKGDLDEG